jgi:hypothetical protein
LSFFFLNRWHRARDDSGKFPTLVRENSLRKLLLETQPPAKPQKDAIRPACKHNKLETAPNGALAYFML